MTFLTFETCHRPPRAVRTPRSLSARAIPRRSLTPEDRTELTIGKTLAANWSARRPELRAQRQPPLARFGDCPTSLPGPSAQRALNASAHRLAAAPSQPVQRKGAA